MHKLMDVLLLFSLLLMSVCCGQPPVRQTANGPVEGIEQTSSLGQNYYAFKGVPFAEPPITGKDPYTGQQVDRRFKAPEPLERKWTKNLTAHDFGKTCVPSSSFKGVMEMNTSEDCLSLNIYVPVDGAEMKTVLVWIHGGAFTEGKSTDAFYGPDFLLSEDNIVVTIQYRVGIFGFLNLGTTEYSGNMGLKDQQLGLKWVYENIENFSGNKNEILLFGESAGGASVSHQILNEESRKYFNRAFIMSGSVFGYFALTKDNHLNRMGECSKINDTNKIVEYLKTTNSEDLAKCYFSKDWGKTLKPNWVPTIESPETKNAFLTQSPEEIYKSEKAPVLDTLFSFTSQEQVTFDPNLLKSIEPLITANWEESEVQLPFDNFNKSTHPKEYRESLEKLREAYFSEANDISAIRNANIALMTDINFGDSMLKNVIHQSAANTRGADESQHKNTFLFRFGVNDEFGLTKFLANIEYDGAAHGDDLCYLFHCHSLDVLKIYDKHLAGKQSSSYKAIRRMVKIVTNFARTGNPSIEGDTPFKSSTSPTEVFCQEINNNPKSSVTTNIKEQLHYDTWREIEEIHHSVQGHASFVQIHYGTLLFLLFTAASSYMR